MRRHIPGHRDGLYQLDWTSSTTRTWRHSTTMSPIRWYTPLPQSTDGGNETIIHEKQYSNVTCRNINCLQIEVDYRIDILIDGRPVIHWARHSVTNMAATNNSVRLTAIGIGKGCVELVDTQGSLAGTDH